MLNAALSIAFLMTATIGEHRTQIPPRQYHGEWRGEVRFLTPENVHKVCGGDLHGTITGCVGKDQQGRTVMVLPLPCQEYRRKGGPYAALVCHELGHANGWPGDHPLSEEKK